MEGKTSFKIQNFLKWFIPVVLVFSVFYAITETKKENIIIVPEDKDGIEILDELNERGYISNSLTYFLAKIAIKFGFDVEAGGFSLKDDMGPFSLLAALASPDYKYVAIIEGMRKEQVAEILAKKLEWDEAKKEEFNYEDPMCSLTGDEGYYFPGKYLIHKDDPVEKIKSQMENKLNETIKEITEEESSDILNVNQILTIASLIQREAAGKNDMKLISGIIWNRIFNDMPLQIDATLQYAKGNDENGWWPPVKADDKYIESPYNTYQIEGLPPGPIANPGKYAIEAALNPENTKCLFYLHDKNRVIHCASTYEVHKKNVSYYLK